MSSALACRVESINGNLERGCFETERFAFMGRKYILLPNDMPQIAINDSNDFNNSRVLFRRGS